RPSIKAESMLARAGSPTRAAVSAKAVVLTMAAILRRCGAIIAKRTGIRFGRHRSIRPSVAANLSGIPLYGAANDQTSHILRLARGLGRLRGGGIWLGGQFLRPTRVPGSHPRVRRLVRV